MKQVDALSFCVDSITGSLIKVLPYENYGVTMNSDEMTEFEI
jgi:hypothetical protein